jgi:hypothetical protein
MILRFKFHPLVSDSKVEKLGSMYVSYFDV